ncbi:hypothetical protein B0H17DRAFT_936810 [Mycena rosella]|uniref:BTB domain-containing protein n=1 Tax=Mycena rosella TaxID=1033263 RepID=A0AAD7GGH7_MYCRO|nr:hypothetical protein B0H17DRAFT_936810 [Mycena rosella]
MEVDTEPSQPSEPQHVQDLWFEDGSLAIQAGNSLFRVYRGILAARSPVFQHMLSFPQPKDSDSELVEGCPFVRMHDAETEVSDFLKAIFLPEYFLPFPAPTTFDIVVGCVRLSHKYQVDYLRRRALVHLSSGYCTTLAEWDSEDSHHRFSKPALGSITVIQLAREVGALWVLPTLFSALSSKFNIVRRAVLEGVVFQGRHMALSKEDQDLLLRGYQIQTNECTADILRFLSHPLKIEGCRSPAECAQRRLEAVAYSREIIQAYPSIPLDVWDDEDWKLLRVAGLCAVCLAVLKQTHAEARQAVWDKLPLIYALPTWEELEKTKAAAIGDPAA